MGFSFGSFAGGVAEGIGQGEEDARRRRELEAQRRMDMAKAAAGQAGIAGGQQPSPQPQGQALQPQGSPSGPGGQPQNVPVPGARPMAPQAPPTAQAGPQGQVAPPQGPQPPPVAPQGPRPVPQPMTPPPAGVGPQGAPGPRGTAPAPQQGPTAPGGGTGPLSDPTVVASLKQSQDALKGMYQAVLQANPKLKNNPEAAFEAVGQMIEQLKGVDQSDKTMLLNQQKLLTLQWQMAKDAADNAQKGADTQSHVGAQERGQDIRADTARQQMVAAMQRVQLAQTEADRRAAEADATRIGVANIDQAGANDRSAATLDFRRQALAAGMDEKQWETQTRAALIEQGYDEKYVDTLIANPKAQGGTPVERPVRQPLPSAPDRGDKGAPAAQASKTLPVSALKKGVYTNFANGQVWTLDDKGRPQQVN